MPIIEGMIASFRVRRADWRQDQAELRRIRENVFVHEQGVPLELEWDGIDHDCLHVLAEDEQGEAIGTGRLLPDGHIGRMAVLRRWRRRGVGSALLNELIALAEEQGMHEVVLKAQVTALPFYLGHGFAPEGEAFLDVGIAHQRMRRSLGPAGHGVGSGAQYSGS
jgi:predicted GNAT family N-acyltransferase